MKGLSPKNKTREEWIQATLEARLHPANVDRYGAGMRRRLRREYAQMQVHRAVSRGDLLKPSQCSECDYRPPLKSGIHAHHLNYDAPFCVQWLCAKCHNAKHKDSEPH